MFSCCFSCCYLLLSLFFLLLINESSSPTPSLSFPSTLLHQRSFDGLPSRDTNTLDTKRRERKFENWLQQSKLHPQSQSISIPKIQKTKRIVFISKEEMITTTITSTTRNSFFVFAFVFVDLIIIIFLAGIRFIFL